MGLSDGNIQKVGTNTEPLQHRDCLHNKPQLEFTHAGQTGSTAATDRTLHLE
jgi:hypothetical protein